MHTQKSDNECLGDFFLKNGNIKIRKQFDDSILVTGISVYEVMKVKYKTPLFLEDHLDRLYRSAMVAGLEASFSRELVREYIRLLISQNHRINEGNIRLMLFYRDRFQENPDIYCYFIQHHYPSDEDYARGVTLVPLPVERQSVHSKIINIGFRSYITEEIKKENAWEALLTDKDGFITEGSKSNFFMISSNKIVTAPEKYVLPGITRKYVLDICSKSGMETEQRKIPFSEAGDFDSCFISGTSPGVLAVRKIGSLNFSPGHPLLKKLMTEYNLLIDRYISIHKPQFNR